MSSRVLPFLASLALVVAGCAAGPGPSGTATTAHRPPARPPAAPRPSEHAPPGVTPTTPGRPGRRNIYAAAGVGTFAPGVGEDRPLVYVPHNRSGDVWEIDPATYQVVGKYPVGCEVQHVVPAHDMRTLYATDGIGFSAHRRA
ncbi:hypothetical protein [Mycobacterium botniense]|uniref:Lipoprotein n=1 Tax=Mycobacterium botniense TaxID=84962 RepID=A0A7I9Y1M9_9MYCO|nr:hypothetical protein [Mycobacterium botniense]GFG75877.1 hypothetical protein MBOT_32420 [Mycobacterium botniense]